MESVTDHSLDQFITDAINQIEASNSIAQLEQLRVQYLGKKGELTGKLKLIPSLPPEQRKGYGEAVNQAKKKLEFTINNSLKLLKEKELLEKIASETIDVSLPERRRNKAGSLHPVTRSLERMQAIFNQLGFSVATGPEIEDQYHNFEALNIPANHPARAMHDTFYVDADTVLRTHTSPVQVHYMKDNKPPIKIVAPGRVYRCDSDATHTPMFHQIEGLAVDESVNFPDLKGVLTYFLNEFFESDSNIRLRPSYFPFTEPSAEFDIECVFCKGEGCRVCKSTGWLEVGGCGMVHPNVLAACGIDPEQYSGYAFGLGVERLTMLRYGIDDLRLMFESDLSFLRQF